MNLLVWKNNCFLGAEKLFKCKNPFFFMAKTFGILSLKGGVGKTSITSALGSAIADFDKRVLLVDGDFHGSNLGLHFNIINPEHTLHHVLDNQVPIEDAIHSLGRFDVLPSSIFSNIQISPLKLKDKLRSVRSKYDYIVLDSSPSMGEDTLAVMLASDGILIVTTPDHPTLSATLKAAKLAKQRGTPVEGLILNRVYNKDFELTIKDIESTTDIPILAVIPHDINMLRALSENKMFSDYKPKSKGNEEFRRLASTLIGEKYNPQGIHWFWKWKSPTHQEVNRQTYYSNVFN
jgi:MinD-like ATPase involved in chromosome partitioning or flagellar assembly